MRREHTLTCILTAALLAGAAHGYQNKAALAVELQSAIQRETVQGDIKGALKQYERILSRAGAADRETAARALLRIGQCHEKLGNAEARKAYERLVRDFPDQKDVSEAKARLAALAVVPSTGERVLYSAERIADARPSRDGRFVAFLRGGAICVLDTASGSIQVAVAAPSSKEARHWRPLASPDGSLVAYTHFANEKAMGKGDLRVSRTDQTGDRVLIAGSAPLHDYFSAVDWSADGRQILVARTNQQTKGLLLAPATGGAVKELETPDFNWWTGRQISKFSPDGKWIAYPSATRDQSTRGFVPTDIRIMPVSGGESNVALSGPGHDYVLGWLKTGELVAVSERSGRPRAYKVPVTGGKVSGEPVMFTLGLSEKAQDNSVIGISPEGSVYVKEEGNQTELHTFRSGNDPLQKLTLGYQGGRPAFSPDGSKLAYAVGGGGVNDNFVVIREMSSGREKMLPAKIASVMRLAWFPDGKSILAICNTGNYGRRPTFRMQVETGEVKPSVEIAGMATTFNPAILNDGKTLVFTMQEMKGSAFSGAGRIAGLNLETGDVRTLIEPQNARSIGSMALSADRTTVVYQEFDAATREISMMTSKLENPQPKEICRGTNCRAAVPFVVPGGREIVFWKVDENGRPADLWRVGVDGGEPRLFRKATWTLDGPEFHPSSGEIILGVDKSSAKLLVKPLR